MSERRQNGVIYLDRSQLQFLNVATQSILTLQFPEEIIHDLDIVNLGKFDDLIKNFITSNKIPPTSAPLILSQSMLFIKDFTNAQPAKQPNQELPNAPQPPQIDPLVEAQKYLESVPFEVVGSKTESIQNGIRVIAANKEMYMEFKSVFEKYGVIIESVTPIFYFEKFLNIAGGFTPDVARTIMQRSDICRQNSLLVPHQSLLVTTESEKSDSQKEEPAGNKRLFVMIGAFVILIIIMIVMFIRMNATNNAEKQKASQRSSVQQVIPPTPMPTVVENVSTNSAELIDTSVSIQIQSNTQSAEIAADLKASLKELGFTKVVSDTSQKSIPQVTQILVLQSVPDATREKILTTVQKTYESATIKETTEGDSDIIVVIGKK